MERQLCVIREHKTLHKFAEKPIYLLLQLDKNKWSGGTG